MFAPCTQSFTLFSEFVSFGWKLWNFKYLWLAGMCMRRLKSCTCIKRIHFAIIYSEYRSCRNTFWLLLPFPHYWNPFLIYARMWFLPFQSHTHKDYIYDVSLCNGNPCQTLVYWLINNAYMRSRATFAWAMAATRCILCRVSFLANKHVDISDMNENRRVIHVKI